MIELRGEQVVLKSITDNESHNGLIGYVILKDGSEDMVSISYDEFHNLPLFMFELTLVGKYNPKSDKFEEVAK